LYTTVLADATLFEALLKIDRELADAAQAGGCLICGGRLDHADSPRKPRGGPANLGSEYDRRTSFCCADCRKRLTPMSVRFLGRKVYLGVVVLLACVLRQGGAFRMCSDKDWTKPREFDSLKVPRRHPWVRAPGTLSDTPSARTNWN